MLRIFIVIQILLISFPCFSQGSLSTKKKKAIQWYTEADNYRVRGQFAEAIALLERALEKDEDFHEAWFRLGQTYKMARKYPKAAEIFERAIEHNPLNKPLTGIYYELGEIYMGLGQYDQAQGHLTKYLTSRPGNKNKIEQAHRMIKNAEYALEHRGKEASVQLDPMPETVNAFPMQYFPVLTADKKTLIYTRRLGTHNDHDEDLVVSRRNDQGDWSEPVSLSPNINTQLNEGTSTISADGRTLIFTSCYGRETVGNCDLYISYKEGDTWTVPANMGEPVNSTSWDSQPSLSADGRTLFFVSNRPGGYGKIDIWYSRLLPTQKWSIPVNAGNIVNTSADEVSPFIHANHSTLFFSSDGHQGFGGFDVFKSEWSGGEKFTEPQNIGPPINTAADQISVFITADGEEGYYSYETYEADQRRSIIYTFKVPESFRPQVVTNYVAGKISEKGTERPLEASIELYDIAKNELVSLVYSDSLSGEYLMVLPEGSQYALYVNKPGFLFESQAFNYIEKYEKDPVIIDFTLQPFEKGASVVLNNIFFDFDSYEIRETSFTELRKIEKFLKNNPQVRIEIAGHTDNKGSAEYNLTLSRQRAKSVYDYLVRRGISPRQISFKGYGDTQPLVPNDSEQNMQKNRRIEFKIL